MPEVRWSVAKSGFLFLDLPAASMLTVPDPLTACRRLPPRASSGSVRHVANERRCKDIVEQILLLPPIDITIFLIAMRSTPAMCNFLAVQVSSTWPVPGEVDRLDPGAENRALSPQPAGLGAA